MGSYGNSFLIQGANEGLRRIQDRQEKQEDRDYLKQKRDIDMQSSKLGLQDTQHRMERQKVTEGREDEAYQEQKDKLDRKRAGDQALRQFVASGDASPVIEFANKYTADGITHYANKNPDGTYNTNIVFGDGKSKEQKNVTRDQIAEYLFLLSNGDPYAEYVRQQGNKAKAAEKDADRKHDLAKIDREGEWKVKAAGLRADGKTNKSLSKEERDLANDLENRSKSRRGKMVGLGNIDMSGISADLANYDGTLGVLYARKGASSTNAAYTQAYNDVSKMHEKIQDKAASKFGQDNPDEAERYIRRELEKAVAARIAELFGDEEVAPAKQGLSKPANKKEVDKQEPKAKNDPLGIRGMLDQPQQ